jgi:hypothetical protein
MRIPRIAGILFCLGIAALVYTFTAQRRTRFTGRSAASTPPHHDQLHHATMPSAAALSAAPSVVEALASAASVVFKPPIRGTSKSSISRRCARDAGGSAKRAPRLEGCSARRPGAMLVDSTACELANQAPDGGLLLLHASWEAEHEEDPTLALRLAAARDATPGRALLVVDTDAPGAAAAIALAQSLEVGWWRVPPPPLRSQAGTSASTSDQVSTVRSASGVQWRAAAMLLRAGCAATVADADVVMIRDPAEHVMGDVDVEVVQTSRSQDRGSVVSLSDPPMGWSAYSQVKSWRVPV